MNKIKNKIMSKYSSIEEFNLQWETWSSQFKDIGKTGIKKYPCFEDLLYKYFEYKFDEITEQNRCEEYKITFKDLRTKNIEDYMQEIIESLESILSECDLKILRIWNKPDHAYERFVFSIILG